MKTNSSAVSFYDRLGSQVYEDALNKSFVYGTITTDFVRGIRFRGDESALLDVGCGTGFVFDTLRERLADANLMAVGVDPARGMLKIARPKFQELKNVSFREGSFEKIPFGDAFFDKITSTLALHWVDDVATGVRELARVLKATGSLDLLMIAFDDGARFKRAIFETQKKHLTFAQAMRAAAHVKRVNAAALQQMFDEAFPRHRAVVTNPRRVVHGSFAEHMTWWKARSRSIVEDVKDIDAFMRDLETELGKIAGPEGIPFDSSCLVVRVEPR